MLGRTIFAAALVAAVSLPVAVSAEPMSLVDAVSFALSHTQSVATAQASLATASHALAQARGNAFPTVNGSLSDYSSQSSNYQGAYGGIGQSQASIFSQNTAQIGTNYNLTTGGLSFLQLASARASEAQARESLANAEDQVATT